jgi:hypothetical protein
MERAELVALGKRCAAVLPKRSWSSEEDGWLFAFLRQQGWLDEREAINEKFIKQQRVLNCRTVASIRKRVNFLLAKSDGRNVRDVSAEQTMEELFNALFEFSEDDGREVPGEVLEEAKVAETDIRQRMADTL